MSQRPACLPKVRFALLQLCFIEALKGAGSGKVREVPGLRPTQGTWKAKHFAAQTQHLESGFAPVQLL